MAICKAVNALSLDRYISIIGINPVHFAGAGGIMAGGEELFPFVPGDSMFYQSQSWNPNMAVSREDIGYAIQNAELTIEDYMATHVAPKWITNEAHDLAQHYLNTRGYTTHDVAGNRILFHPKFGKFISGGQRTSSLIEAGVSIAFTDEDNDGFVETATLEVDIGNPDISLYEIKAYFPDNHGNPQYEIRAPKSKTISGSIVKFVYNVWQLIKPSLWERFPSSENARVIDIKNLNNLSETVDVYREKNDITKNHMEYVYENVGDGEVESFTQGGYIKLERPSINGISISPANNIDGEWYNTLVCGKLKYVNLNYYSGFKHVPEYGENYWDYLHEELATIIAYLATARLECPLPGNTDINTKTAMLQKDMSMAKPGEFQYTSAEILSNPFGTKVGEIYAWLRLEKYQKRFMRYN